MNRELGKDILTVENLCKTINGELILNNVTFTINRNDKVIVLGEDEMAKTILFKILAGEMEADSGTIRWGTTVEYDYLPQDNSQYFENNSSNLIEWLAEYSKDQSESFIRGFLGRMLFSGDQPLKKVSVLSGGEKVRCMFSKLMVKGSNFLILDQPTNHLDLESIQAVNDGLVDYRGSIIFTSHDHSFIDSIANKIVEITPSGAFSVSMSFSEFLEDEKFKENC